MKKTDIIPRPNLRGELRNVSLEQRAIYIRAESLRLMVSELEAQLLCAIQADRTCDPTSHAENNKLSILNLTNQGTRPAVEYAARKALLALVEGSQEYKDAAEILAPMLAELAELESRERYALKLENDARLTLEAAQKAAMEKALAEAEQDEAVIAAAEAHEKAREALIA